MYYLTYEQKIPLSPEESWDFFSSPANLKILTPEHLGFQITNCDPISKMYPGQIISYIIKPVLNVPIEWVTEITHVQKPDYFIDEQRFGPYKFWHHEHRFYSIPGGTRLTDTIYYKMPFGMIGKVLNHFKVKQDLEAIFTYRHAKLEKLFGFYTK